MSRNLPTTTAPASFQGGHPVRGDSPCASAESQIGPAAEPAAKCRALYSFARCILVIQNASLLSIGLASDKELSAELVSLADKAIDNLNQIGELAAEAKKSGEDLTSLQAQADVLLAFARLFSALGKDPLDPKTKEALLDACNDLAPYLDEADAGLVESARLWQAVAYRRAGRAERALQLLRPALASPSSARLGLWFRIERCRALADRGQYAAAVSLAQQLASRTASWLSDETPGVRASAAQTIDRLRADLYRKWARHLRAEEKPGLAETAAQQADEIEKSIKAAGELELTESIAGIPEAATDETTSDAKDKP